MMTTIHQFWAICALLIVLSTNATSEKKASPDQMQEGITNVKTPVPVVSEPYGATGPLATGYCEFTFSFLLPTQTSLLSTSSLFVGLVTFKSSN